MKIEVTHTIKFDTKVESLLELVAQALISSTKPVELTVEPTKLEGEKASTTVTSEKGDKPNVATKTRYFVHEGTDELVVVKKGESLEFLETDIFDEVSAAVYKELKAKNEEPATEKVPEEESETTTVEDEAVVVDQPALKIEDLRMIAAKFVSAAKQKELKALFGEFKDEDGNPGIKLSSIQEKDYHAFVERAKERLAELGVE
ncbi:MAG: hypothetical protein ABS917_11125 [Solibacillus sp.]|uniref:hypothetical protein n=1 Tax=Solibacillus sp. TaxID=1909654 RepID=UPI00331459AD